MRVATLSIGRPNQHARDLRRNATQAERLLWQHLRNRQLRGFKFRQQATVGPFVADFLCAEKRLIVELDGGQHGDEIDARRTAVLNNLGYHVIRFWNHEVNANLDGVMQAILSECERLPSRIKWKRPSSNFD